MQKKQPKNSKKGLNFDQKGLKTDQNNLRSITNLSESALQINCFTWFHNAYPSLRGCLFSVPNGGQRTKREAARLKYEGLMPGIPDLILIFNGTIYPIEMKTLTGIVSDEQMYIHNTWHTHGINTRVIRTEDEFRAYVRGIVGV